MTTQELEILLRAKNMTDAAFRAVQEAAERLEGSAKKHPTAWKEADAAVQKYSKMAKPALLAIGGVAAGVAASIGGIAAAALKTAADFEQTQLGFSTMLGSAEEANAFLAQLQDFAAKTPFEFKGLKDSSQQLLAMGYSAQNVIPIMTAVGDAVASAGKGEEAVKSITMALGQMKTAGRVGAQDMLQLTSAGVNGWKYLAAAAHKTIPEIKKMAETGALDANESIKIILEGMEKEFHGSMEKQSKSLKGVWSTVKDNASLALLEIGNVILPGAKMAMDSLGTSMSGLLKWTKENHTAMRSWAAGGVVFLSEAIATSIEVVLAFARGWNNVRIALTEIDVAFNRSMSAILSGLANLKDKAGDALYAVFGVDIGDSNKLTQLSKDFDELAKKGAKASGELMLSNKAIQETADAAAKKVRDFGLRIAEGITLAPEAKKANTDYSGSLDNLTKSAGMSTAQLAKLQKEQEKLAKNAETLVDKDIKSSLDDLFGIDVLGDFGPRMKGAAEEALDIIKEEAKKKAQDIGLQFKAGFKAGLADLPGAILGAIQGGGDIWAAIGSTIGGKIGSGISGAISERLKDGGKLIGGSKFLTQMLGSLAPGIGSLAGSLLGKVGGFIGGLFGGNKAAKEARAARDEYIKAAGGIDALRSSAAAAGISLDALFSAKRKEDVQEFADKFQELQGLQSQLKGMAESLMGSLASNTGKGLGGIKILSKEDAAAQAHIAMMSFLEVMHREGIVAAGKAFAPIAGQLKEALKGLGGDTKDIQKLLGPMFKAVKLSSNEAFAGAAEGAKGLADTLQAFRAEQLPLTADQLKNFGQQADAAFKQAMKGGANQQQAMMAILPLLQQLDAASKQYGVKLDENSQKLLDQAKEMGIAFPEDPVLQLVEAINQLIVQLGGTLPEAAKSGADGVRDSVQGLDGLKVDIPVSYKYPEGGGPGGPDGGNPYPGGPGYHPPGYAVGGTVPYTPGGRIVRVAEQATEHIMTDAQLASIIARAVAKATTGQVQGGGGTGAVYLEGRPVGRFAMQAVENGTRTNRMRVFRASVR